MIYSMTGFARVEKISSDASIQWEIKSVNNRFLEAQFRLPETLRDMETDLRNNARTLLSRGKVDCSLKLITQNEANHSEIDPDALKRLMGMLEQVQQYSTKLAKPNPLEVLRWPGVLAESAKPSKALRAAVCQAFDECVQQLLAHRQREGENLSTLIQAKLNEISSIVSQVRLLMQDISKNRHAALLKKISALDLSLNADRLEQEVALLVQRADVVEEMDRLDIQVSETRIALQGPGPHGRRLDFLMQELNREANTLGSKSVLAATTQQSVDLKVIIEQIREQVQNIE